MDLCRFRHARETVHTALSGGSSTYSVDDVSLRPRARGASTYCEPKPVVNDFGASSSCTIQARDRIAGFEPQHIIKPRVVCIH